MKTNTLDSLQMEIKIMSDYLYTNAQFRSILNGLGFKIRGLNEPNFPISSDESSLKNDRQAVIKFQTYFGLVADGIVGPNTRAKAQQEIYVIQLENEYFR